MDRILEEKQVSISFREVRLPRSVRVDYPRSLDVIIKDGLQNYHLLIASQGGKCVGYIRFTDYFVPLTTWVTDLVISGKMRRQGVATALLIAIQDWTKRKKNKNILLEMQSKNYSAICLAQKLGFEFCGFQEKYYSSQDLALFFILNLR
jgi:ribosomal protein S18 acetylase RimI-like enzyme